MLVKKKSGRLENNRKRRLLRTIRLALWLLLAGCAWGKAVSAGAGPNALARLEIHGFLSQGFLQSDRNNFYAQTAAGTFQFNEFGLNFGADVTDRLHVGLQLLSRDLGEIGNNTVTIDWAFADYRWKDWLGLRAGQLRAAWGLYNETRDVDMVRTSIFLPSSLYAEEEREMYANLQGLALYGNVPLQWCGNLNYQWQYGEKNISADSGLVQSIIGNQALELEGFRIKNLGIGSLDWNTPLKGLRLGVTNVRFRREVSLSAAETTTAGTTTDASTGAATATETHYDNDSATNVFSAEYTLGDLILAAEYLQGSGLRPGDSLEQEGYYGSVSYRVTDWWEIGAYYSVFYPDKHNKQGAKAAGAGPATAAGATAPAESSPLPKAPEYKAWQKEFVLTTRFDLNDHWTLKLEGHVVNGTARVLDFDNPNGSEENAVLFAVKTTFNF